MNLKPWIKRHPVLAYILLTIAWSWSIWSLLFLFIKPGGLVNNPPPVSFVFVVVGGFGPTLSGLLLTRVLYGKTGMQALGKRFRNGKVGRWWLALLIIPAITALTPIVRRLAGYEVDFRAMLSLIPQGVGLGLTAGLMEEFGWRGFLLPHLLKRHSPLASAVLVGLVWGGLWHGYADYFGLGDKGLAFWPLMLMVGPVLLTVWSLVLTWVYEHTKGSLLLSILMHASISSSALIFGLQYTGLQDELTWTAISVGFAVLFAGLIWMGSRHASAPKKAIKARKVPRMKASRRPVKR